MSFIRKIKRNGKIYLAEVESYRSGGKVRQRYIGYKGIEKQENDSKFEFHIRDIHVQDVKVYGPVIVLESIARDLGLFEILGADADKILTLAFAHCLGYKSARETEDWFKKTDLAAVFGVQKISIDQIYSAVERLSKVEIEPIEKSIFENLKSIFGDDEAGVIYDGTNTHLSGSCSSLANYGKDKEGVKGRKLIQIGLGVTRTLGLPIFHQVYSGNIHDTKMFNEAILKFRTLGLKSGLAVFDRGITSSECVSKLQNLGWKCLAGLSKHRGIQSQISKMDFSKLQTYRNLYIQGETTFYAQSVPFCLGPCKGKLIILQNPIKKQKVTIDRLRVINAASEALKLENKKPPEELTKYFNKDGSVNTHAIKRDENEDGFSFLFTNAKLSVQTAISQYFEKDLIEQCFRLSKSTLNLRPIRFILDNRIRTHVFICYIALSLLTTVRIRLKKANIYKDPGLILHNLESIFKIYLIGKNPASKLITSFTRVNTMTKQQKLIIKVIAPNLEM